MDKETIKWANAQVDRLFPKGGWKVRELADIGFDRPIHNARLTLSVICRSCGAAVPMVELEDGRTAIEAHYIWHHPLAHRGRLLASLLADAITSRNARRNPSMKDES